MQTILADGPGVLDISHHDPVQSRGLAPVLIAHIAGQELVVIDGDVHVLDDIQRLIRSLENRRIIVILLLGFQLQALFQSVADDHTVADACTQALDTIGYGSEFVHIASFLSFKQASKQLNSGPNFTHPYTDPFRAA